MGTRADFYVGRGEDAEWLGSVTWDGYPDGFDTEFYRATTEEDYRELIAQVAEERNDWTDTSEGWPWPWEDSRTTDYAYAYDDGAVYASPFGRAWYKLDADHNTFGEPEDDEYWSSEKTAVFPNMKSRAMTTDEMLNRSGLLFVSKNKE